MSNFHEVLKICLKPFSRIYLFTALTVQQLQTYLYHQEIFGVLYFVFDFMNG